MTSDSLIPLLQDSLAVWRLAGRVEAGAEGVLIHGAEGEPRVTVVSLDHPILPLRWQVRVERAEAEAVTKSYAALPGMLRAVRLALDPEASQAKLTIALGASLASEKV
jgi:hypothetical protein